MSQRMNVANRGWLAIAVGGMLAFAAACGSSPSQSTSQKSSEVQTVRVVDVPGAYVSMPVYVADAMGFFSKRGIKVTYIKAGTGSTIAQVLEAGAADIAGSDPSAIANVRAAGGDVVYVVGMFKFFPAEIACQPTITVSAPSYPQSMETLVGKTIGITSPGSATDTYTRYSLIAAGIEPSKVKIVPIGGLPQLVAAFQAKRVDCVVAYQPMQSLLANRTTILNWQAGQGPAALKVVLQAGEITTSKFASTHADAVQRFALAIKDAEQLASDPNNASKIAPSTAHFFTGVDQPALTQMIKGISGTYTYQITPAMVANAATVYSAINGKGYPAYADLIAAPVKDIVSQRP